VDGDRVLALTRLTFVPQHGRSGRSAHREPLLLRIEVFLDRAEALEAAGLQE
jgi:hypothetical protein